MEGVLVIHKEKNMTSHDVVGRLRRILKTKKIGHAGTLDPMATGVLVIGVGRATKLLQKITAQTKVYRATLTLGFSTTTYDLEGETVEKKDYQNDVSEAMVLETLHSFLGDSKQIPPIYSAIKKDGKPLYEYAREGKEVEIEERDIHISRIDLVSVWKWHHLKSAYKSYGKAAKYEITPVHFRSSPRLHFHKHFLLKSPPKMKTILGSLLLSGLYLPALVAHSPNLLFSLSWWTGGGPYCSLPASCNTAGRLSFFPLPA